MPPRKSMETLVAPVLEKRKKRITPTDVADPFNTPNTWGWKVESD